MNSLSQSNTTCPTSGKSNNQTNGAYEHKNLQRAGPGLYRIHAALGDPRESMSLAPETVPLTLPIFSCAAQIKKCNTTELTRINTISLFASLLIYVKHGIK
jgi:hypothetical protein